VIGRLSLELLEAFVAVVETGNITHAGAKLNRTQPCVSTQIRRLEERAGKPLLSRSSRTIGLTPAGRMLHQHALDILRTHEEAKLKLAAPELTGEVHVGLPEWYATARLQSLFCEFARVHPQVKLGMTVADSATLHRLLSLNEMNLAIALVSATKPIPEETVTEPLHWVASPDLDISERVPLILFPEPCPFRDAAFDALSSVGREWYERVTTTSVAAAHVAVASGIGVCVLPSGALTDSLQILGTDQRFPNLPSTRLAVYKPLSAQSPTVEHLGDYLSEFLRTSVAQLSVIGENRQRNLRIA